jgi:transposase
MPKKRYIVELTREERTELLGCLNRGSAPARRLTRARALLLAEEGHTDEEIAEALHISRPTVERLRKRFVDEGLERALKDRHRKGAPRKLSGRDEALLVATACSNAPEGQTRWTMQLLADRLVEIKVVESISDETVRRCFKKRLEALAEGAVVHSQRGRRVRLPYGRPAGSLRRAV